MNLEKTSTEPSHKVVIQGYAGAFHEVASRLYFEGKAIEIIPAHTFEDLVSRLEKDESIDRGLMAIENSIAGSLMGNYLLLNEANLEIVGEVYLRIEQNLMVLAGQQIDDLEEVHSHPMAIAQCRKFFRYFPEIRLIETADTALSAKHIRENNLLNVGAIASTLAAEMYDLDIIAPSIETNKRNFTRFLVLRKKAECLEVPKNADKVSLSFVVEHEVGSLHSVLAVLAAYKMNLTKIESVPILGKEWEYRFFIDFVVNGEPSYKQAIKAIKPLTTDLKVLGIYKQFAKK